MISTNSKFRFELFEHSNKLILNTSLQVQYMYVTCIIAKQICLGFKELILHNIIHE